MRIGDILSAIFILSLVLLIFITSMSIVIERLF